MVLDGDGLREWREEHGGVAGVVCMAAEPPCVLRSPPLDWTHNGCRGADGSSVVGSVEEALDMFWVVEEGDAAVNGGVSPSLPVGGEASTWQPSFCATSPALGLDSSYGCGHITASCCSGGGVEGSPMSSISSNGSGVDLVGRTPAAVWEVDLQRRVSEVKKAHDDDELGGRQLLVSRPSSDYEMIFIHWFSIFRLRQSLADLNQFFGRASAELGSPTTGAEEEIMKEDNIKQLLQILRITSFEREKLLAQNAHSGFLEQSPSLPLFHPSSGSARGNDGISHFDALTRMDSSQSNDASSPEESSPFEFIPSPRDGRLSSPERDAASETIDHLLPKKALPEKGKLLQAVIEAGPLLQTLLVAGSLPQWRNPPPLRPFQIPPVSVRGPNQNAELVHPSPRSSPSACTGGYQIGKRQKL
ncbi:unnamed protein product [Spirodela intermedia]|uniref:Uncharacterized protein n=1 Tax=Spirodela intermedia TaxID=51605 RepID=A0A7I8IB24_SPIIN|nr:unnamed protein product [Spirodela intermedia]CAA6654899.1 unnamed protein product [Spirodela intermedia]